MAAAMVGGLVASLVLFVMKKTMVHEKLTIERGEKVNKGESIGLVGKTGSVRKPQLHFEIRKATKSVNPENYFNDK